MNLLNTAHFHSLTRERNTQNVQLLIIIDPGVPLPKIMFLSQDSGSIVTVSISELASESLNWL